MAEITSDPELQKSFWALLGCLLDEACGAITTIAKVATKQDDQGGIDDG